MLVNGIAPIIAPALGGIILNYGPWRIVFVILTMFGIVMLIGTLFKVPESLEKSLRVNSNIGTMLINFKELLKPPLCITHVDTRCHLYCYLLIFLHRLL